MPLSISVVRIIRGTANFCGRRGISGISLDDICMSIIRRRGYARTIFIPGINQDVAPRGFYRQGHYASIVMYACKKATVGNRDPGNTCPTFPLLFSPPPPIQQSGSSLRRSLPKERDSSSSVIAPTPFPSLYERRPR